MCVHLFYASFATFDFIEDDIFSSSYSASIYIARILSLPPTKRKVFVLGESGIEAELASEAIPSIGGSDPSYQRAITPQDHASIASGEALDKDVGVVLCGLDFHINYLKLAYAYHYITQQDAVFLATNGDVTFPNHHTLFPGAGACAAPLVAMLGGRQPETLGKPSQKMMDAVESKFRFERKRACMVGDRLNTDITFGVEGGLGGTLCVLTGVTRSPEDWAGPDSVKPSAWVDKLGDLAPAL
ncbi:MAG: p-nitrophenyl phosphatase [Ramalina farinacea]|uniref:4-nitrophenylphosphatase n=1 Tax=Ramalina farinacea TaxID=258253 RepID=A0AA43QL18_9LECA|nr:p-nitrophenyl phosphatase [Ramalina farinacea]